MQQSKAPSRAEFRTDWGSARRMQSSISASRRTNFGNEAHCHFGLHRNYDVSHACQPQPVFLRLMSKPIFHWNSAALIPRAKVTVLDQDEIGILQVLNCNKAECVFFNGCFDLKSRRKTLGSGNSKVGRASNRKTLFLPALVNRQAIEMHHRKWKLAETITARPQFAKLRAVHVTTRFLFLASCKLLMQTLD